MSLQNAWNSKFLLFIDFRTQLSWDHSVHLLYWITIKWMNDVFNCDTFKHCILFNFVTFLQLLLYLSPFPTDNCLTYKSTLCPLFKKQQTKSHHVQSAPHMSLWNGFGNLDKNAFCRLIGLNWSSLSLRNWEGLECVALFKELSHRVEVGFTSWCHSQTALSLSALGFNVSSQLLIQYHICLCAALFMDSLSGSIIQ